MLDDRIVIDGDVVLVTQLEFPAQAVLPVRLVPERLVTGEMILMWLV
ncbi:hypothetical protein [Streptomyces sp. NPDC006463]